MFSRSASPLADIRNKKRDRERTEYVYVYVCCPENKRGLSVGDSTPTEARRIITSICHILRVLERAIPVSLSLFLVF